MCENSGANDRVVYQPLPPNISGVNEIISELHPGIVDLGPLCSRWRRSNEIYKSFLQPTIGLSCRKEMVLSPNECCHK